MADPALLLAAESTGDLHAKSVQETLAILGSLNRDFGEPSLMVTKYPKAVSVASVVRHLDRGLLLLAEGQTTEETPPAG